MSHTDGPEARTAYYDEYFDACEAAYEREVSLGDELVDTLRDILTPVVLL